ncbi:MAG TPA: methyltransferase domain-containing protein [Candidatus Dormibacteraeota bacterium]|jgi:methionine biosynthesis protein MetW|nr:methyltransferase domain-containing protein [Candidatus Dormibacteraeota bacterium]
MPPSAGNYDFAVDPDNTNSSYGLVFRQIPDGCTVLDLGCAHGTLGAVLAERRGCTVTGVDHDEAAVADARGKGIEAHVADLGSADLDALLGHRRFDRIILADVLEHLVEPERLLAQAVLLLAPGGAIVASIPNISHIDIQLMLAGDEWQYVPAGLLDRTHLRFFTLAGIRGLAEACGLRVTSVESVRFPPLATEVWQQRPPPGCPPRMLRTWEVLAGHRNPHATVYQHVAVLEPAAAPAPAAEAAPTAGGLDVVVTTREGRLPLLRDALYSVAALTHPSVCAVVVVQSADPSHPERVRELTGHLRGLVETRIVVVEDTSRTRAHLLNAGLDAAGGEFVCFLDDGDVLYPQFASVLIGELSARPLLSAAYGAAVRCSGRVTGHGFVAERKATVPAAPFDRVRMLLENHLDPGTVLYRRADLAAAGIRFDESLEALEEWALLRRLCRWHEIASVPESVFELRTGGPTGPAHGTEAVHERARAAILRDSAGLPLALTEEELRTLVSGSHPASDALAAERARAAALAAELAESHRRLDALWRSPVLRAYRGLRRTGLHRPLRAVYRLIQRPTGR